MGNSAGGGNRLRRIVDTWRRIPKLLRRSLVLLVVIGLATYVLLPQLGGLDRAFEVITQADLVLVSAGIALQVAAIGAQAELTRSVLPDEQRPVFAAMLRVEFATMAVSHTVPGGTAAGSALAFSLLRRSGVSGSNAGFALGIRGLGSAVVLNALLWVALVFSIPAHGLHPVYTTAALLGVVLLGSFSAAVLLLLRGEDRVKDVLSRVGRHVPFVDHERVPDVVEDLARRLRALAGDRRLLLRASGWSAAYWLLGAASLWALLTGFGAAVPPDGLFVAFGVANVLAAVPVTPRGLGVVEAVMIPLLIAFGVSQPVAVVGVLAWRLVGFWAPIPVGALAYMTLRAAPPTVAPAEPDRKRLADAVHELADVAVDKAESAREWAERHGMTIGER